MYLNGLQYYFHYVNKIAWVASYSNGRKKSFYTGAIYKALESKFSIYLIEFKKIKKNNFLNSNVFDCMSTTGLLCVLHTV